MNMSARTMCQRRCCVRTSANPRRGKSTTPATTTCVAKRSQTTMITGITLTSHFALPSSSENTR